MTEVNAVLPKSAVWDANTGRVSAHYLHSSGNFHGYDEKARILFSGDVGAALPPPEENGLRRNI